MNLEHHNDIIARIYDSGYFTNHGPMAKELESCLQDLFAVENAVVVANESLAIIMGLSALDLSGRVGVSSDCPEFVTGAVAWAGLEPVACQGGVIPDSLAAVLVCDRKEGGQANCALRRHAEINHLKTVVYQLDHFCPDLGAPPPITIVTLGEKSGAPTAHCAVILTRDDILAEKCRNIRSSYGARKPVEVRATANGRVSEFQAGAALLFLKNRGDQSG